MRLYIDPGTGSMLFSLAIGLISILWYGTRKMLLKMKFFTPRAETSSDQHPLIIFSEDKRYWKYFEPICRELDKREIDTLYVSASEDDPGLKSCYPHIKGEYIGSGNRAYTRLNFIKAKLLMATIPGLEVYQWKRSKDVQCYIHLPHAANAMTTTKMFGLDFYDVLLVSAQYQIDDTRELERLRHEPEKELVRIGVPYMDDNVDRIKSNPAPVHIDTTVLLAPSWGKNAILSRFGNKIIELLSQSYYHIIIRPHPQSLVSESEMIGELKRNWPQLEWNTDVDNFDVLNRADIMISDFSGIVFEYALAFDKPVICVETDYDDSQYDTCWLSTPNWTIICVIRGCTIIHESSLSQTMVIAFLISLICVSEISIMRMQCGITPLFWLRTSTVPDLQKMMHL